MMLLPCTDPNLCLLVVVRWEMWCLVWLFSCSQGYPLVMSCEHKDFVRKAQGCMEMVSSLSWQAHNRGWALASREDFCLKLPSPEDKGSSIMKKLSLCTPAISLTLRPNPQRASFQLLSCTTAFPNKVLLPKWRHHDHLCSSPTSTDYNPIPVGCAFAQKYGVRDKWWCASEAVRVVRTTEKLVQESFRDSVSQIQETTQTFKHQAIDIAESNCSGAAKQNCSLRMIVYFS